MKQTAIRLIDERFRLREDPSRRRELETACARLRTILCDADDPGDRS